MYRQPDIYVRGTQINAAAEAALTEWAHKDREAEAALAAYEQRAEFKAVGRPAEYVDGIDDFYDRMEADGDDNQRHHDRYLGTVWE